MGFSYDATKLLLLILLLREVANYLQDNRFKMVIILCYLVIILGMLISDNIHELNKSKQKN